MLQGLCTCLMGRMQGEDCHTYHLPHLSSLKSLEVKIIVGGAMIL